MAGWRRTRHTSTGSLTRRARANMPLEPLELQNFIRNQVVIDRRFVDDMRDAKVARSN